MFASNWCVTQLGLSAKPVSHVPDSQQEICIILSIIGPCRKHTMIFERLNDQFAP